MGVQGARPPLGGPGGRSPPAEIEFQRLKIQKYGISWLYRLTFDNTTIQYDLVTVYCLKMQNYSEGEEKKKEQQIDLIKQKKVTITFAHR